MARGDADAGSDLDLLVALSGDEDPLATVQLSLRLAGVAAREVDVARLDRIEASAPLLLERVLDEGRVIVDRDGLWADLRAAQPRSLKEVRRAVERMRQVSKVTPPLLSRESSTPVARAAGSLAHAVPGPVGCRA